MKWFQRAIIYLQRIKIGEDFELWPSQKVDVNGQIIAIFTKIKKIEFSLWIVSSPRPKGFLCEILLDQDCGSVRTG